MTIRSSAYDTTATSSIITKDILAHLNGCIGSLQANKHGDIYSVTGSSSFQETLPTFIFPMIDTSGNSNKVFIDIRPYASYNVNTGTAIIKQVEQVEALELHAVLTSSWAHPSFQKNIIHISQMPMAVFMTWLGESIGKRMNLSGRDQYMVTILASILYYNSFNNDSMETEDDKNALFTIVTRNLRYNDTGINESLIKEYSWINSVTDFCKAAYEATQSVAIKNLNPSILYSLIGGSMWGSNAAEKLAVALEYPPMWIVLIYQVLTDRSYRGRCQLSTICERSTYKKYKEDFVRKCLIIHADGMDKNHE